MRQAINHLIRGDYGHAEAVVRRHLATSPSDVSALCLLGDLAARSGIHGEAERLFRLALSHAPLFDEAQLNLARILALRDAIPEAIAILERVIEIAPDRADVALTRITFLGQIGAYASAREGCEGLVLRHPGSAAAWLAYGHLQKTLGDAGSSIECYRRALAIDPGQSEAWWGLANLKTYHFSSAEIAQLTALISSPDATPPARAQLHFALAKGLEDVEEYAASFEHYVAGNHARRGLAHYDSSAIAKEVDRAIAFFGKQRFAASANHGHGARDPIFIVGLPRSGSTLIEQILASHSQIQGTAELPYVPMLVHRLLAERWLERDLTYPEVLDALPGERLRELGRAYIDAAAVYRHDDRPFFIDKLPNNWSYVGFIRLILPNAKIIDARREPMACGWSNFRQWFARGQDFSYALGDIGSYYRDYRRAMAHFDDVLPGAIHRVEHEHLLEDPETEIRALLNYLGLPFEPACLRPHENTRPVRTASSEQVRRPINRDAVDRWRHFEPWLNELRLALGDAA
ncbi:sulfotransferase [Sphingomonas sp. RB3P16]|uniref:tetratricopeptide repeat-containing sulfotransferase family protein n=1 Tax=Parasphingomonas frigoris TaxID=3096163 RepID=UPI002FC9CCE7